MKKMVLAALLSSAFSAFAGGYFSATSKFNYEGWACDPGTPNYAGWVHLWRDDGKFLGALPANQQREPLVASNCGSGDKGIHGFNGVVSFPSEYFDNRMHVVRAYFVRKDDFGLKFELFNSVTVLFDAGAQPPTPPATIAPIQPKVVFGCALGKPGDGWVNTGVSIAGCPGNQLVYEWTFLGDLPIGYSVATCENKAPLNWQMEDIIKENVACSTGSDGQFSPRYFSGVRIKRVL